MLELPMLYNNTADLAAACVALGEEKATSFDDLFHPYVMLYVGHCLAAAIGFFMSLTCPLTLAALMLLSGLSFLYSGVTGHPMWGYEPGTFIWWGVFIKWLIVNAFATIPVLILRGCKKLSETTIHIISCFIYFILGANVIWTLGMDSNGHIIVYLNRIAGVMLTISLIFHCVAVCVQGKPPKGKKCLGLFVVQQEFPYGFGTSLPWLVCYTVWNCLFIAKITIGGLLQDVLFWVLMVAYQYWDRTSWGDNNHHKLLPIELYFGFARPVQLGTYIGFTEFVGTFVPYFYEAPVLTEHQPLPVNSHSFFLFVAFVNMIWSFVVTFWALQRLFCGLGFFEERFRDVHELGEVDSESDYDSMDE